MVGIEEQDPTARIMTTYISSDLQKLYEREFLAERTQTASTRRPPPEESEAGKEAWRHIALKFYHAHGYDPAVIRFYEDIIAGLQRELARYKAMVMELLAARGGEGGGEDGYAAGNPTELSPGFARKLRAGTRPGLPMVGHET